MNSTQRRECENANEVIWAWYLIERDREWPSKPVIDALQWYVKNDPMPDYGYTGDWKANLEYTSDRMNGGRAKAILRLMKEAGYEA
jgi:hypothetical protein